MIKQIIITLVILFTACSKEVDTIELRIGNQIEVLDSNDLETAQMHILMKVETVWSDLKEGHYSKEFVVQKSKITKTKESIETETNLSITFKFAKQIEGQDVCYAVNHDKSLTKLFEAKSLDWKTIATLLKGKDLLSTDKLAKLKL